MSLSPEQFALLATKEEHKELEAKVDKISVNVDKILSSVDGLAKNVVKFQEDITSNQGAHDRIDETVNGHEVRIGKMEASIA